MTQRDIIRNDKHFVRWRWQISRVRVLSAEIITIVDIRRRGICSEYYAQVRNHLDEALRPIKLNESAGSSCHSRSELSYNFSNNEKFAECKKIEMRSRVHRRLRPAAGGNIEAHWGSISYRLNYK